MKKALKITLISLSSLLVLLLIAVAITVWIVFTPSKLTPIVQKQVDKYITCKSEIGDVELTFFSTFPQFGLQINGVTLINPMDGAPSDTLLNAKTATATLDFKAFWNNNELILHNLDFENVTLNAFVNKNGKANYDVYKSDTTTIDTSAFENPFKLIDIQNITLKNSKVTYTNISSQMYAGLQNLDGRIRMQMKQNDVNAVIEALSTNVWYKMDTIEYVKDGNVKVDIPLQYLFDKGLLSITDSRINYNGLVANVTGTISGNSNNDDINTDLHFTTEKYQLKPLLDMIPKEYTTSMEGMTMDGFVTSTGTVKGIYNDSLMPLINVNAQLEKGTFEYTDLPYKLRDIAGDADVIVDLNNEMASKVILNDVSAKTGQSEIEGKGLVDYILADDMLFDLDLKMKLNLEELNPMMPEDMAIKLSGFAQGAGKIKFMLSEAMAMNIPKMKISGKFDATNLGVVYDSLTMKADKAKLDVEMPNYKNKLAGFLKASMQANKMDVYEGKNTKATIFNSNFLAETSDIMETEKMNTIKCDFNFDQMNAGMDDMSAKLDKSKGNLLMKANFSDSISTPYIKCNFDVSKLTANMDSTDVEVTSPKGYFTMQGDKSHPEMAVFDVDYNSTSTKGSMGSKSFSAENMAVKTNIVHNDKEKNMMLQWIPTGYISMNQGKVKVAGLNANIEIPKMQFDFTPDEFNIKEGKVLVDNSDFELKGKLWNISKYLHDEDLLMGEFNFNSNTTDVYKLMDLTNGFGVEDTTSKAVAEKSTEEKSSGPYMVPKGIDLKLHAQINQALLGFDSAKNVIGDLYVKDGILVLQDMRFTTTAAKMQLTAMYKTPLKNHLYVGLDFHMMDMQISELLSMFPDIDTIMPMLRSFGGKGEFHIAVETYLDSMYNVKRSTLRGVSSIKGENLVLMDGETFSEIAKKLRFSKHAVNKVDSLSAEFTIFKNEVDIYPFMIVMDKYKAIVAGRHNLDMSFKYHISVVDSPLPFKLGVDVAGTLDEIKNSPLKCIKLVKPKYTNLDRPAARKDLENKQLELRKLIHDELLKKVVK